MLSELYRLRDSFVNARIDAMRALLLWLSVLAVGCNALPTTPTPTPNPTAFVIPTRTPKPSPTPFTGHYGFLVAGVTGYIVRSESSEAPLGTIDLAVNAGAVSPDGRLFAGWTRTTPAELRVVDVAKTSQFSKVLTLPADERGGGLAWSTDGTGIVYAAESAAVANSGLVPATTALRLIALTTSGTANGAPREIGRFDSIQVRPAAWDRLGGDLVVALGVLPGTASEYIVVRGTDTPQRRPLSAKLWQEAPAVSGDGRWVVTAAVKEQLVRWFRADDPTFVVETHGEMTTGGASALGRPGEDSAQIGVVIDRGMVLFDGETGARSRVPSEGIDQIVGWRFDGSAAIVRMGSQLATLEIGTWSVTRISGDVRFGVRLP
jgi:hypothetical protein